MTLFYNLFLNILLLMIYTCRKVHTHTHTQNSTKVPPCNFERETFEAQRGKVPFSMAEFFPSTKHNCSLSSLPTTTLLSLNTYYLDIHCAQGSGISADRVVGWVPRFIRH